MILNDLREVLKVVEQIEGYVPAENIQDEGNIICICTANAGLEDQVQNTDEDNGVHNGPNDPQQIPDVPVTEVTQSQ